jgi:hypothetical protein
MRALRAAMTVVLFSQLPGVMSLARASGPEIQGSGSQYCSSTAALLLRACGFDTEDTYWTTVAKCTNIEDAQDRAECMSDAQDTKNEGTEECQAQYATRLAACQLLGEDRYDPDIDPSAFEHNSGNLRNPNRYFPLSVGYRWVYRSGHERNTVEVLDRTKKIDGVNCVVFRDLVSVDGSLHEATDDWYAQAEDGTVWYFGEEVKNYETFAGDRPAAPELVSIDGSFKAGREFDKPGIIFLSAPAKGDVYLEEFSLGNAEDVTEILSTTYAFGADAELDHLVPKHLATRFCNHDCVVSKNYSLLEPNVFARKYYAPGIGVFLEVEVTTGEVVALTDCNFDSRCANLPNQ